MSNKNYFFKSLIKEHFGSFFDDYKEMPDKGIIIFTVKRLLSLSDLEDLRFCLDFDDIDLFIMGSYIAIRIQGVNFP